LSDQSTAEPYLTGRVHRRVSGDRVEKLGDLGTRDSECFRYNIIDYFVAYSEWLRGMARLVKWENYIQIRQENCGKPLSNNKKRSAFQCIVQRDNTA